MYGNRYRHPFVQGIRHRLGQDCRWRLAGEWLDEMVESSFDKVDRMVGLIWLYRRQRLYGLDYRGVKDDTFELFYKAEEVQENRSLRESLMLFVLSGSTREEIGSRFGLNSLDVDLVWTWEQMFFDVRDALQATGWLSAHVIEPERLAGNLRLVAKLNVAIRGNPATVQFMLDAESRPPNDETERRKFEEYEVAINGWIAVNQPFENEKDVMQMLRWNQQLNEIDSRCQARNKAASPNSNEQRWEELWKNFQFAVGSPNSFRPSSMTTDGVAPNGEPAAVGKDQG